MFVFGGKFSKNTSVLFNAMICLEKVPESKFSRNTHKKRIQKTFLKHFHHKVINILNNDNKLFWFLQPQLQTLFSSY